MGWDSVINSIGIEFSNVTHPCGWDLKALAMWGLLGDKGHYGSKTVVFTMVCDKCEKKLGRVITPDPWKSGARNTVESGGRKIGENKAITGNKSRFSPYTAKFETCRICRQKVHQVGSHYCQACAYKKGICAMCGKKLLDTKNYKQSSA
ncbi:unnamed protein product [Timema podura]|uniref:Cysteine-rich PDZ-binding protein n=1 Tax=Timema podura TaxID=61482 RepID=A0ABN7NZ95_TIMPD|nr:unnamed protein product [Timema podura]